MFTLLSRLSNNPHILGTVTLQGFGFAGTGLYLNSVALLAIGISGLLATLVAVLAIRLVLPLGGPVLTGVVVTTELEAPKRAQVADVQAHMHCTKELSQVP